jgi:hypothetical protein
MTLVGLQIKTCLKLQGMGWGLVGCCSGKGYWMTCGGRSGAGAYTEYGVGTGHVAYFPSDKNTRLTMNCQTGGASDAL